MNSPADLANIQYGDFIYQIKIDGTFYTVTELGGYEAALTKIQGEEGTVIEVAVLRDNGAGDYQRMTFSMTRAHIEDPSVYAEKKQDDSKTAVVWIKKFDSTTPKLFRDAVSTLRAEGVEHFVFDVRDNPGGDLRSIRSVLSYFLKQGDVVIQTINKDGDYVDTVQVEPVEYTGMYESCSVSAEEIGMFSDLDFAVLCNENTASAAEVFTASLRDYGMTTVVGRTTYGKGLLQSIYDLSTLKAGVSGYLKMTTHAYVTRSGETYHGTGILPNAGYDVALSDEAAKYHLNMLYGMDQTIDNQLQKAFSVFGA